MEQSATPTNSGAVTVLAPASTQLATAVSSGTAATTGGKRSGADRNKQSSAQQLVDDPNQYHAKPRELAEIAAKRPRDNTSSSINSNSSSGGSKAIFSQTPFSSLGLDPRLLAVLEGPTLQGGLGLRTATMVQTATISALLEQRRNVLMKSQTGSGKTLAYLLPLINDLITMDPPLTRADGTRALILAPTRELCSQIGEVLQKLTTAYVRIVGGSITGGEKRKSEKARLRKGVVVLVATPGRLLDHLKATEAFSLQNLRWVVLDEADRLLDMGFEKTILEIMSIVKGETSPGDPAKAGLNLQQKWSRQTASLAKQCRDSPNLKCVLASATLSKGVIQLSAPIMSAGELLLVDADRSQVGDAHINSASVQSLQSGALPDFTFRTNAAPGDSSNSEEVEDVEPAGKKVKVTGTTLDKGEAIETPSQLSQYFMMVTCKWRLAALLSFLRTHSHQKVVVFFSTCDSVDYHALLLHQMDWPVELDAPLEFKDNSTKLTKDHAGSSEGCKTNGTLYQGGKRAVVSETVQPLGTTFTGVLGSTKMYRLHGNVPQRVRQSVYKDFCAASSGVLLCTDVAARGLDLPKVDWILQYDPPCDTADYVHRVGRTARKGLVGAALLFLLPTEAMYLTLLASHSLHPEALSLQSLFEEAARLHNPGALKFRNTDEMHAVILQRRVEGVLYRNKVLLSAAKQAFRSFVRAYATHSGDTKGIFRVASLHLGHVAKSFGLLENPKAVRSGGDDVIGKIFNGHYASAALLTDGTSKNIEAADIGKTLTRAEKKQQRDEKYSLSKTLQKTKRQIQSKGTVHAVKDRQKLRAIGKKPVTVSGKFRKATGGYFKNKLRNQTTSEFSS